MQSMREIRAALEKGLQDLGYKTSVYKSVEMRFALGNSNKHSGKIELRSANAKRFEISIIAKEEEFKVDSMQHYELTHKHIARKRFGKVAGIVPDVLEWIAGAVTTNGHLDEMLHPDRPLPESYKFAEGTYVHKSNCTYPGMASEASVVDIVTTNGRRIVHTVFEPGSKPYFLMSIAVKRGGYGNYPTTQKMVTDGDIWYPVREHGKNHTIFLDDDAIERLATLNQNDRALITAEIRRYIDLNLNEADNGAAPSPRQ